MCYHEAKHSSLPRRLPPLWGEAVSTTGTGSQQITPAEEQQLRSTEIPLLKKKNSQWMCPGARGASGTMAPELGWDSALQSCDSLTGSNLSRVGCKGRQPRLPSSIAVPKWEGRGAGNDDESSHESPGSASRVS